MIEVLVCLYANVHLVSNRLGLNVAETVVGGKTVSNRVDRCSTPPDECHVLYLNYCES